MTTAKQIQDIITAFNWSNFGLDEVDDADAEYAEALADRIFMTLVRDVPTGEFSGELVEAPDIALTHDEVLRADALNSASRLLAGIGEPLADHIEDEDADGLAQFVGHLWTKVAAYGEEYLRTGKVTPPPDGSDDSAEPASSPDAAGEALPIHASPHCACGVNDAGQRYVDPICRPKSTD